MNRGANVRIGYTHRRRRAYPDPYGYSAAFHPLALGTVAVKRITRCIWTPAPAGTPQAQRIGVAYGIPVDVCVNSCPRHEFIVREAVFPKRFSG
jgi:hypothetical protein